MREQKEWAEKFQFPSNGKVYSEDAATEVHSGQTAEFQFPSNGKVDSEARSAELEARKAEGFNSLQTGKWIQRKKLMMLL